MPLQAHVIDIDAYYARPRRPGPAVIDLTEEPDTPSVPAVPLSGRSSARNPQPHTQLQSDVGRGGPQLPPLAYPTYAHTAPHRSNLGSSARDNASRSRTQVIDLTGDDLPPPYAEVPRRSESIGNIEHRYHYSNNNTPEIIMGEVRRSAHPAPPPLPPAPPALPAPGLGAPFRFGGYNTFDRIHGIFLDFTRMAFRQPFGMEFPHGNPHGIPQGNPNAEQPAPPVPTREGFTRDTGEDKVAVCPSCNEELAYNPGDSPSVSPPIRRSSRAKKDGDHHFWAVKKCGHVFCSQCFEGRRCKEMGFKHIASNKVNCAVDDCTSDVAAKSAWVGIYL